MNMTWLYERVIRGWLFATEAEESLIRVRRFCRLVERVPSLGQSFIVNDHALRVKVAGLQFPNPVGLAAGFDNSGEQVESLAYLGFGFVEIGSITRFPWPGNPAPRVFFLPDDQAMINRVGMNNPGAMKVAETIADAELPIPIGINIAKTPAAHLVGDTGIQDIIEAISLVYPVANYLTLNISSPDSEDGKNFEDPEDLSQLLQAVHSFETTLSRPRIPLLLKLSADFTAQHLAQVLRIGQQFAVDGFIVGNTTQSHTGLVADEEELSEVGAGGVSGVPIFERMLATVRTVYQTTSGTIPIIGCGGIFSANDAYRCIRAGASLVQLYTGLVYRGPWLMRDINIGLLQLLNADRFKNIAEAIGADAK